MVTMFSELFSKISDCVVVFILLKGFYILEFPVKSSLFSSETLYKHTDSHSWGERMRVDNNIRGDTSVTGERHVFLRPEHTQNSLLPMTRRELISNNRISLVANSIINRVITPCMFISDNSDSLNPGRLTIFEFMMFNISLNIIIDSKIRVTFL